MNANHDIMRELDEFSHLYSQRPIFDNSGGMKSPHMFGLYRWLKDHQPELIIESGIWKGQGTWLLRKTCPSSRIISIDVNMSNRVFVDERASYYDKDITTLDLKSLVRNFDQDKVLVFFDDHQNFDNRVDFLIESKVRHVIFEDNYPTGQGDCVSPKKLIEASERNEEIQEKYAKLSAERVRSIRNKIGKYTELQPIFVDSMTRWKVPWNYETVKPLLSHDDSHAYKDFFDERFDYTWICHLELKNE